MYIAILPSTTGSLPSSSPVWEDRRSADLTVGLKRGCHHRPSSPRAKNQRYALSLGGSTEPSSGAS